MVMMVMIVSSVVKEMMKLMGVMITTSLMLD